MLVKPTEVIHLWANCGAGRAMHWVCLRGEGMKDEDLHLDGNMEEWLLKGAIL